MTETEHTGQQWVRYVENEFAMHKQHVTLPQNFLSIDDAVDLAFRLHIELILVEDSFISWQPIKILQNLARIALRLFSIDETETTYGK